MQSHKIVVVDFEGFHSKNIGYIIKELALCAKDYSDLIHLLPPISFHKLSTEEKKNFSWITKYLHGIHWNSGTYPYVYLPQLVLSLNLRHPKAKFFAKGKEKCQTLSRIFQRDVVNLEELSCPKIEHLPLHSHKTCKSHCTIFRKSEVEKHCALKKAKLFYDWLVTAVYEPGKEQCSSEISLITGFDSLCLG